MLVAVGVSADAFAVSTARGVTVKRRHGPALLLATTFRAFQALMPLIGWLVGVQVVDYIHQVDHWIAFGLLAFVGGRMIREAFDDGDDDAAAKADIGVRELLLLGVATSID